MSGLDLKPIFQQVAALLKKDLDPALEREMKKRIVNVFRTKVRDDLTAVLVQQYDRLAAQERAEFPPLIHDKDPSALEEFRQLFIDQIREEISFTRLEGDTLVMEIGDKELWGYGREGPPQGTPKSADILVYYIEGITGEFAFISDKHYRLRRDPKNGLGRFGKGFLISRDDYKKEKWEEVTGIKFEDVRHPISGQGRFTGFDTAARTFNYSKYITEVVQEVLQDIPRFLK